MKLSKPLVATVLSIALALPVPAQVPPPTSTAAAAAPSASAATFSQQELDQLLAPVALYPDALLAQVLMASTYPIEVVQAERWVKANPGLKDKALEDALAQQPWDASVKSLAVFPQVLMMMSDKLDWTQKLGDAFLAQQKDVMATAQALRAKAVAEGTLKDSNEQKIVTDTATTTYITIEPTNPEVVYVPTYDPVVVYGAWPYPAYPPYYYYPPGYVAGGALLAFTAGIIVGAALWGNCNWGGGNVNVNINRYNNFNRTNISNGNWNHNVEHRGAVPYRDKGVAQQYGRGQSADAASRDAFRGHADAGRESIQRGDVSRDAGGRRRHVGHARRGCVRHRPQRADARLQQPRQFEHEFGALVGQHGRAPVWAAAGGQVEEAAVAGVDMHDTRSGNGKAMEITMRADRCNGGVSARRWVLLVLAAMMLAATGARAAAPAEKVFASPEDAASALVQAVKAYDRGATRAVLGNAGEWLSSGDAVADNASKDRFVAAYEAKHAIVRDGDTARLTIGEDDFPFAFPIVKSGGWWRFDTAAGKEELLARRVGRNELDAIKVMQAIADAQRDYASEDRNGDGVLAYAQKFASSPGKRDGLFWPVKAGEAASPLGELVVRASGEGYRRRTTARCRFTATTIVCSKARAATPSREPWTMSSTVGRSGASRRSRGRRNTAIPES